MATRVRVVLDLKGLNELMKSEGMQNVLNEYGSKIASRAGAMSGAEYGYRTHLANWVAITNVYPDSEEAAKDNYRNNTLLKAVRG